MMGKLTQFALKNSFVIILLIFMLVAGGIYSAGNMQMEAMPNISIPVITISTLYPGASPEDVNSKISEPMQKSLSGIQGVSSIKTISNQNISFVVMEFDYSTDLDKAEKQVQDAVNKVSLPDGAKQPSVNRISFGSFPIMTYTMQSNLNTDQLSDFINNKLQPKLSGVSGVSGVDVQGNNVKQILIKLNNDQLRADNLTIQNVQQALAANNITMPAGQIDVGSQTLNVNIDNGLHTVNDLKSIPLIVVPSSGQAVGAAMGQVAQGMNQLGSAVGQIGGAVGELGQSVGQIGQSVGQLGGMVGGNLQALAMLNVIQKSEAAILSQQAVLASPGSSMADKAKAQTVITQAQATMQGAQAELDSLLSTQMAKAKDMSAAKPAQSLSPAAPKSTAVPEVPKASASSASAGIKVVFLKDVANITLADAPVSLYARNNGKQAVVLNIYKTDDANTVTVAKDVQDTLNTLAQANPQVHFTKISDSSGVVKTSVNGMLHEGLLGALFAILVIALFLRDLRATVIAVISIPLSILITLIVLPQFGFTLNTMTLGGIAVAIGRIVDDSIVVIENIYRNLQRGEYKGVDLIKKASAEVASAITSSTITTVAVFVPLGMVSGIVGRIFVPFAYTVVISILASLLVALTVVPVMSKYMILRRKTRRSHQEGRIVKVYRQVLHTALNHKFTVLLLAAVLMAGSVVMVKQVGVQFLPSDTTSILQGSLTMPPGTSLSKTNENALQFEKYLESDSNVKNVVAVIGNNTGSTSVPGAMQEDNQGSFTIVLKDGTNKAQAAQAIMNKAKELQTGGATLVVESQSSTGQKDSFELTVNGDTIDDITNASNIIMQELSKDKDLINLNSNLAQKKPQIVVNIDGNKAGQNGLTPVTAAALVRSVLGDNYVMTLQNGNQDTDVVMGYSSDDINSVDKVGSIEIDGANGPVQLKDIANIKEVNGAVSIAELNGNQYASITADISGSDTQKASTHALNMVNSIKDKLPKDITYSLSGSTKDIQQGFSQMGIAMLAAVLLVYIVMVVAFGEGFTPLAILFSLPFAGVGAMIALFITRQPLTMSGLIGMLMLIGIVVTNAIVLLDRVKTNRSRGMAVNEALAEAGSVRLRPIFMTAIATVMATLPLALGFSEGTIMSQGLGIVVIGGLTLSTILTLVIVPVMYGLFEGLKRRLIHRFVSEEAA